jgi:hypothetical protein
MKIVVNGLGNDVTTTVLAHLRANRILYKATLYLIGRPEDPRAIWMTDWDTPLLWRCWGRFSPSAVTKTTMISQVGLAGFWYLMVVTMGEPLPYRVLCRGFGRGFNRTPGSASAGVTTTNLFCTVRYHGHLLPAWIPFL